MATGALNTNSAGAVVAGHSVAAITHAPFVTLYVMGVTGTHNKCVVSVEESPDGGTTWFPTTAVVRGTGCAQLPACSGTNIQAKVLIAEGATSTSTIYLLAK